jgi:hypothetical protein
MQAGGLGRAATAVRLAWSHLPCGEVDLQPPTPVWLHSLLSTMVCQLPRS